MATFKPFRAYRPRPDLAAKVASKPYDVLDSEEARQEAEGNPWSFYHINKPEIDLPVGTDLYSDAVYDTARKNLDRFIADGYLVQDDAPSFYVYRQVMPGALLHMDHDQSQTGIVGCAGVQDYFDDVIKKHEYTRPVKEEDRIRHMDTLSAHVGPVFTTYPDVPAISAITEVITRGTPDVDFVADDGVRHVLWAVSDPTQVNEIESLFAREVPATYIADGHHRAASSAKVGLRRKEQNPNHTGQEDYNYFLSVLFPASELCIIDYNRVIDNLNGLTEEAFLGALEHHFELMPNDEPVKPSKLHEFGMYTGGRWYRMTARPGSYDDNDPIDVLDVTILSKHVLDPILGIKDQRTDKRIDFVGGIRGLKALQQRVDSGEMKLAFSLYPVSIQQLIDIADSGQVMPPKSTWFEPKLRSGLFVHRFEEVLHEV